MNEDHTDPATQERMVATQLLDVAYEDRGPPDGSCVLLLHGWPDDIRTWDGIVNALHSAGFRTIAPYLRGFGPTRFLSPNTARSGQLAALASDVIDFAATASPLSVTTGVRERHTFSHARRRSV